MSDWNFDKVVDRHNTSALKTDALNVMFGKSDLIPMWVADMDFEVCEDIVNALKARFSHHIYGYSCPCEKYWQSIIDWQREKHGFEFTREELDYVPGVVKGIALAVNYFTSKGDRIVIQPPVYHPFKMVIEGNDRVVVNNPLLYSDGKYSMDIAGLKEIFEKETPKMLILCNPHNPIGIAWNRETLKELATLCKQYDVIVISDEIHGDLAVFDNVHTPFATVSDDAAEVGIVFGAPSKSFNIPGVVSSWVVVKNPSLCEGFFKWMSSNEFDEPTFTATIATEAAYTKGGEWLTAAKKYIEENILAVEDFCTKNLPGIHPMRPEASFLVWLDCRGLGMTHEQVIDLFVNRAKLALNDGTMFGIEGSNCMRLNVGTSRTILMQALNQLAEALNNK